LIHIQSIVLTACWWQRFKKSSTS